MADIFLIHSPDNLEYVNRLKAALEEGEHSVTTTAVSELRSLKIANADIVVPIVSAALTEELPSNDYYQTIRRLFMINSPRNFGFVHVPLCHVLLEKGEKIRAWAAKPSEWTFNPNTTEAYGHSVSTVYPSLASDLEHLVSTIGLYARLGVLACEAPAPWRKTLSDIWEKKNKREQELRNVLHVDPKTPDLPKGFDGVFNVLRKWASYTTIELMRPLENQGGSNRDQTGGGYFLWWKGKGLVIDPGLGFGEAFRAAGYLPRNISAVVATHHHIDHTGDMLPILTCLFEMNEGDEDEHAIDFRFAPGVFSAFANIVAYLPGVASVELLRPDERAFLLQQEERAAKAVLTPVRAKHRDLTGRHDAAIGFRLDLEQNGEHACGIGFTGDTGPNDAMSECFKDVDLLVAHIGSIYPYDFDDSEDKPSHLGLKGATGLLTELRKRSGIDWDPLVLVSEWGEELASYRTIICRELIKATGIKRVFPAERGQRIAIKPGRAEAICARDQKPAEQWRDRNNDCIEYLCDDCCHDHESSSSP